MGNSFSSPTKDETRRVNRLSKPLTKKFAALSAPRSPRSETDAPELASGLIGWQNPWVGSHTSKDVKNKSTKPREIPPTLFESEPDLLEWNLTGDVVETPHQDVEPLSPGSGSLPASPSVRRASYQPGTPSTSSEPLLNPQQPKRANSIQTPLQRHRSAIYGDKSREATSSNTHFMVGNQQRFSLTRRRSLLTRPGIATRRQTTAARRFPSPIGEPEGSVDDPSDSNVLKWPLPPLQRPQLPASSQMRPTSPTDPRYTQLGALKLGSLRVVNGSASPCPSERMPLSQTTQVAEPGLGLDCIQTMRPKRAQLEIPAVPDLKKSDDVPGSPFSFEKSPTITVKPRKRSIFPGEMEDEGIGMCDEGITQSENNTMGTVIDRSTSRSLNKSDSGYSSAASVHSAHRSRTPASIDSQTSGSYAADSGNEQLYDLREEKIQRHFSFQGVVRPGNFSHLYPNSPRWYDSSASTTRPSGPRARRSTLCAPRNTEYPVHNNSGPYDYQPFMSGSSHSFASQDEPSLSTRGPLYGDRFSTSTLNVLHGSSSTATLNSCQQSSTRTSSIRQMDREISAHRVHGEKEMTASRSRSRSKHGSRVWRHKSVMEIPQLPTILSPDPLHPENEITEGMEIPTSEPHRGRHRSRSQDFRRRKLTKSRPQPDVHMTTSPYALE